MLSDYLKDLKIDEKVIADIESKKFEEADLKNLEVTLIDIYGRPLVLKKEASQALKEMLKASSKEKISIIPFSGFRSYLYQKILIEKQLEKGRSIAEILTNIAAPGCSEHHTGNAVDVTSEGVEPLVEEFENTKAFKWLEKNAADFNFTLSFPRDNDQGFIYEPWHWCYAPIAI